ncbi:HTH domain-containing protein [Bacillus cereus]|uniref:HTH domain-containing protein n=1 Tax=Paenibacillus TaxID=44249 RepID=UPI001BCD1B13|nr:MULTISPECIES: HTH domain-containing protein [Paenibacillus]MEB9895987.1 HTH domain-containing protein [Bacillus cereus]
MAKSRRLTELMMKLNSKKRYTVQELADEFGVSYRTMWRYLQEVYASVSLTIGTKSSPIMSP